MALTVLTAINRALGRLAEGDTPMAYPADDQVLVTDALRMFSIAMAQDPQNAQLLRKDFFIAATSGVGSLSASLAAAEPMIAEFLPTAHLVAMGSTTPMQYLPDRFQLSLARPLGFFVYFCNDQGTLRTRNTDGSLSSLNTTVTATAQYTPTIGDVPTQLEELFLNMLAEIIKSRALPQPAQAEAA